jgi:hypothetical protein
MPVILSFIASNVAGRTKKTVVSATFLIACESPIEVRCEQSRR